MMKRQRGMSTVGAVLLAGVAGEADDAATVGEAGHQRPFARGHVVGPDVDGFGVPALARAREEGARLLRLQGKIG